MVYSRRQEGKKGIVVEVRRTPSGGWRWWMWRRQGWRTPVVYHSHLCNLASRRPNNSFTAAIVCFQTTSHCYRNKGDKWKSVGHFSSYERCYQPKNVLRTNVLLKMYPPITFLHWALPGKKWLNSIWMYQPYPTGSLMIRRNSTLIWIWIIFSLKIRGMARIWST